MPAVAAANKPIWCGSGFRRTATKAALIAARSAGRVTNRGTTRLVKTRGEMKARIWVGSAAKICPTDAVALAAEETTVAAHQTLTIVKLVPV